MSTVCRDGNEIKPLPVLNMAPCPNITYHSVIGVPRAVYSTETIFVPEESRTFDDTVKY